MSRPIDLTWYEPTKHRATTRYHPPPMYYLTHHAATRAGKNKHLTDPELAAEYWAAVWDLEFATSLVESSPHFDQAFAERTRDISNALYRFATHPHALQEEPC